MTQKLANAIFRENWPFVLVMLLGMIAWSFHQVVDFHTGQATIAIGCLDQDDSGRLFYEVGNLSSSGKIDTAKFEIRHDDDPKFSKLSITVSPPFKQSSDDGKSVNENGAAQYLIHNMLPGARYRLLFNSNLKEGFTLRVLDTTPGAQLTEAGLSTWLVEKRLGIAWSIGCIALLAFIILSALHFKRGPLPTGQTAAFLACFLSSMYSTSESYAETQIMVRDDTGIGIKSDIERTDRYNKVSFLGTTDDAGNFNYTIGCVDTDRIKAKPANNDYYNGKTQCKDGDSSVTIKVTKKEIAQNLEKNAEHLSEQGRHSQASLLFFELAVRMRHADTPKAIAYSRKSCVEFNKVHNIGLQCDTDKFVFSGKAQTKMKIQALQKQKNLEATGYVNYRTVQSYAEGSISPYLFQKTLND